MQANEKENIIKLSSKRNLGSKFYSFFRFRRLTLLELLAVLAASGIVLTWVLAKLF